MEGNVLVKFKAICRPIADRSIMLSLLSEYCFETTAGNLLSESFQEIRKSWIYRGSISFFNTCPSSDSISAKRSSRMFPHCSTIWVPARPLLSASHFRKSLLTESLMDRGFSGLRHRVSKKDLKASSGSGDNALSWVPESMVSFAQCVKRKFL